VHFGSLRRFHYVHRHRKVDGMVGNVRLYGLHRTMLRGAMLLATLTIAGGGAIIYDSSPASASAAPSTDSVYVFDYPTSLDEPLPSGTPDVVTSLTTALTEVCDSVDQAVPTYEVALLSDGQVVLCTEESPQPVSFIVVGVGPVGVVMPNGAFGEPGCGVAFYEFPAADGSTILIGVAPPGATC
jgi:hypothetical protein